MKHCQLITLKITLGDFHRHHGKLQFIYTLFKLFAIYFFITSVTLCPKWVIESCYAMLIVFGVWGGPLPHFFFAPIFQLGSNQVTPQISTSQANPFWEKSTWKKERRIMPSLVATMSALARKPCVRTIYVRTNRKEERRNNTFNRW